MALEIERKYLVDVEQFVALTDDKTIDLSNDIEIMQGYLSTGRASTVRVRLADDTAILCIKQGINDTTCHEFEYEIPVDDAETMLEGLPHVMKTRFDLGNGLVVDAFKGDLYGLIIAEKECDTEAEMDAYTPPEWCSEDVTGDDRYYNCHLVDLAFVDGELVEK